MPELPEVETVVRQLAPRLRGRRVERLLVRDPKLARARRRDLAGRPVREVTRVGKRIVVALGPGAGGRGPGRLFLEVHLRMTGRLLWAEEWPPGSGRRMAGHAAPPPGRRPLPPPRAVLVLDRGAVLFVDPRRFGTMRWTEERPEPGGLDPTGPGFTAETLARLLAGARTPVKPWLMRQDRLEGFGNIYASEVLYAAGIDPRREAGSLSRDEVRRLAAATRRIMRAAIRHCGTTFSDFQGVLGTVGGYRHYLRVYDRAGEPCPRRGCGGAIERIVQQGRSTYFCPHCQR